MKVQGEIFRSDFGELNGQEPPRIHGSAGPLATILLVARQLNLIQSKFVRDMPLLYQAKIIVNFLNCFVFLVAFFNLGIYVILP
jgi:hypothetical protein